MHGKNVSNFNEIYEFLNKNRISQLVKTKLELEKKLDALLSKKNSSSKAIRYKIGEIGEKILNDTQKEINFFLENAI